MISISGCGTVVQPWFKRLVSVGFPIWQNHRKLNRSQTTPNHGNTILCPLPPNSFLSHSPPPHVIWFNSSNLSSSFINECHIMTLHEQDLVGTPDKPDGRLAQTSGQYNIQVEQSWYATGQRCDVDQNKR